MYRVTTEHHIDDELRGRLLGMYEESYDALRRMSPVRQYYERHELVEALVDSRMLKFILWEDNRQVGFAVVTTELQLVPWIEVAFYEDMFPVQYRERKLYYFCGFCIDASEQGEGRARELSKWIINHVAPRGVALFDSSHLINEPIVALVTSEGVKQLEIEHRELGTQHYHAVRALGFKPGFSKGNPDGVGVQVQGD